MRAAAGHGHLGQLAQPEKSGPPQLPKLQPGVGDALMPAASLCVSVPRPPTINPAGLRYTTARLRRSSPMTPEVPQYEGSNAGADSTYTALYNTKYFPRKWKNKPPSPPRCPQREGAAHGGHSQSDAREEKARLAVRSGLRSCGVPMGRFPPVQGTHGSWWSRSPSRWRCSRRARRWTPAIKFPAGPCRRT